jgi:hypothetical protein
MFDIKIDMHIYIDAFVFNYKTESALVFLTEAYINIHIHIHKFTER